MRTNKLSTLVRLAGLGGTLVLMFAVFLSLIRPWYLHWGATEREVSAVLPGDEFVEASSQTTRGIDIDAPAAKVWSWLLQLGQDRGGFFSYELLENLVGTNMNNIDRLLPDLRPWKVGDKLWMYPADKLGGAGHAVLQRIDPGQALIFGTRQLGTSLQHATDGSWAFLVQPIDGQHSRLLVRGRGAGYVSLSGRAFERLIFEPVHFMMERKMMEGIKARAEGFAASPLTDLTEVALFACCFAMLISAALHVVKWPSVARSLLFVLALGLAFQLLTFVQPPWIVGLLIVAGLGALFEQVRYT
ncbi:MAG: hypothetical protein JWN04_6364 [Myxococcaceae bacterium]|nr:hypothetical protein [Myxococcaceae bacterium]